MSFAKNLSDYFGISEHDSTLRTEIIAGITTFLTMSYIVVVNPTILQAAISIEGYTDAQVFQMLSIVTILASVVAIFVMAFYANRPFGLAPGLGLNAFFAYTVVLQMGVSWQAALAATFIEGLVFILITAAGAREYVIKAFPKPVKLAVGTGIGLFLALIGLQEMGVVVGDEATLVTLGNIFQDPVALLALIGLFFTLFLYAKRVKGSIIIGIISTSVVAYLLNFFGMFPDAAIPNIPEAHYNIAPLAGAFLQGFTDVGAVTFAVVIFTFFFVDFFDTAGTVIGVSQMADFLDEDGNLPEINKPLMADAIGTTFGAMVGTSTVTTYIESSTGVEEGGRTGMTALVIGILFLISLIFVPLAAGIPSFASHLVLVIVAILMMTNITDIEWDDLAHSIPAGLTILVMPFTYNIGYGIAAGIISYPIVKAGKGEWSDLNIPQIVLALLFVVYFVIRTGVIPEGGLF